MPKDRDDLGAESPHSHLLQTAMPIIFTVVWILDSFVFKFSTMSRFVPLPIRLVMAGFTLFLAFLLMGLSHQVIFGNVRQPPAILDTGVFGRVRHPMYLGSLLIYLGFSFATLPLVSFGMWICYILLYDNLATYEEKDLIRMFGEAYLDYQRRVPKWFPRLIPSAKQKGVN